MSTRDVEMLREIVRLAERGLGGLWPLVRDSVPAGRTSAEWVAALSAGLSALEALERQGVIVAAGESAPEATSELTREERDAYGRVVGSLFRPTKSSEDSKAERVRELEGGLGQIRRLASGAADRIVTAEALRLGMRQIAARADGLLHPTSPGAGTWSTRGCASLQRRWTVSDRHERACPNCGDFTHYECVRASGDSPSPWVRTVYMNAEEAAAYWKARARRAEEVDRGE